MCDAGIGMDLVDWRTWSTGGLGRLADLAHYHAIFSSVTLSTRLLRTAPMEPSASSMSRRRPLGIMLDAGALDERLVTMVGRTPVAKWQFSSVELDRNPGKFWSVLTKA